MCMYTDTHVNKRITPHPLTPEKNSGHAPGYEHTINTVARRCVRMRHPLLAPDHGGNEKAVEMLNLPRQSLVCGPLQCTPTCVCRLDQPARGGVRIGECVGAKRRAAYFPFLGRFPA